MRPANERRRYIVTPPLIGGKPLIVNPSGAQTECSRTRSISAMDADPLSPGALLTWVNFSMDK